MVAVEVVSTPELGDRSYVAHDGVEAVVIDPQRDVDRIEELLARLGVRCSLVVETHVHNDYVTGGFVLAQRTGARYAVAAADEVQFDRLPVRDGDELRVGSLTVRVLETPGHTDTHVAYVVSDDSGTAPAVFTGGSLLYGSVGRTDLVDVERTDELTRAQFHSVRRLADLLPDDATVHPTHGFGSFCSSGSATGGDSSTLGEQRAVNDAFRSDDVEEFVDRLVAGLTAYPTYYARMAPLNRQGPQAADLSEPRSLDAEELRSVLAAGEWVVDLRQRRAFAAGHLEGSVGIELGSQFATYLGWLLPWNSPVTILGGDAQEIAAVQRQLVRIGIDQLAGAAVGTPAEFAGGRELASYPVAGFPDLPAALSELARSAVVVHHDHGHHHVPDGAAPGPDVVLDVRRDDERARGGVPGSLHIPLAELVDRIDELAGRRAWVHCASGFRAGIAASLLDRAGVDVVLLDDAYAEAVAAGIATG